MIPNDTIASLPVIRPLARQVTFEFHDCDPACLADGAQVERMMNRAATESGATIVKSVFHQFSPQGVSGVLVIAESHMTIHTWPEYRYAAVDIFTCGATLDISAASTALAAAVNAGRVDISADMTRGIVSRGSRKDSAAVNNADSPCSDTAPVATVCPCNDPVECRFLKTADRKELAALYQDAGWWDAQFDTQPRLLDRLVSNSALFVGAFQKKKMVGMGRALSDRVSDAYIQDVAVLTPCRGQGIGRCIINTLISGLKDRGVGWIGLVGEPGTKRFYEALGFRELTGHIPFKLQ